MRPNNLDSLGFKYKIGDVLMHKGMSPRMAWTAKRLEEETANAAKAGDQKDSYFREKTPEEIITALKASVAHCTTYVVCGREADECPGGIQLHYYCNVIDQNTGGLAFTQAVRLHEEMLIPVPAFVS